MQWSERHGSAGPQTPGSKPPWGCCYLLAVAPTVIFSLRYYQAVTNQLTYGRDPDMRQTSWPKAAGTKLPTWPARQAEGEFLTL